MWKRVHQMPPLGWARRVRGDVMIVRGQGRLDYDCIRVFDKVIHPDSRVDLGSSHHFMHNGEEINLEPQSPVALSRCEVTILL